MFALAVFNPSIFDVVLPGRFFFGWIRWIWETSDLFAVGHARNLLRGGFAAEKSQSCYGIGVILNTLDGYFFAECGNIGAARTGTMELRWGPKTT